MLPINQIVRAAGFFVLKNSPTILTALGAGGVVATAVLAVKATPTAMTIIKAEGDRRFEEEDAVRPTTKLEIVKLCWRPYVPAILMGTATIACVIGANTIGIRRNAALLSLYTLTEKALTEYQGKVVEVFGGDKAEKITDEIAQDRLNQSPVSKNQVIITGKGDTLCFDSQSGRYFKSDLETIRKAENELNKRLLGQAFMDLNSFYEILNLEPIPLGDDLGWLPDNLLDLKIAAKVADDGTPCIVLDYNLDIKDARYYR